MLRRRLVGWLGVGTLALAMATVHAEPLTLEAALREALAANPDLKAAQARLEALQARVPQAGALPDPMVAFGAANLPIDGFDLTQTPMTQLQIGVSQRLPYPGKLNLREQIAAQRAEAGGHALEDVRLRLRAEVIRAWWAVFSIDRALEALQRSEDLVDRLIEVAQTRYQVGRGTQGDVLLAQLEKERLADRRLALRARRSSAGAELIRLLSRDPGPVPTLPSEAPPLPPPFEGAQVMTLIETARAHNPDLQRLAAELRAAERAVALARRERLPDFTASASYGWRDDRTDLYSLRLGVSVPLYADRKQDRAVDEAHARYREIRARWQALRDRIEARIRAYLADYRSAREQTDLYRESILPQAQQTVEAMLSSYQVGKAEFINVVRAEVTLDEYDARYWQTYGEAWRALAALEAELGKELNHEHP